MKYTEAWASIASQNSILKLTITVLGVLTLVLGMTTLKLTFKEATIIERGCFSKLLTPAKEGHSKAEIEAFLALALSQRFDSNVQPVDGMISFEEMRLRQTEHKEFGSRKIKQKVVVNTVTQNADGTFMVDGDRIIAVNDLRSAFRFQLEVQLESKPRSLSNPYGLLIASTKHIEEPKNAKEAK
ncbi:MAG: hypothetical protein RJB66_1343 [Pseudomonadota bacterium]|jgi:hypothetical protein